MADRASADDQTAYDLCLHLEQGSGSSPGRIGTGSARESVQPVYAEGRAVMPVAADDAVAKERVLRLARDLGFDAVDAGELAVARLLEPLAMLWIRLVTGQGLGRGCAFRLMRRCRLVRLTASPFQSP
jgi:hypothetical protein